MTTLTTTLVSTVTTAATTTTAAATRSSLPSDRLRTHNFPVTPNNLLKTYRPSITLLHVVNDGNKESSGNNVIADESEAEKMVDGMDFGELCDEFECISSPSVESTARQLVRDILELRQGNRALGTYAVSVTYKDPVRSFKGREKYKRPLWVTQALENTKVGVQEMVMLSTSVLNIKWTLKGKPKSIIIGSLGGELVIKVNSKFTLNQISGQVIEHEETWDLSESSPVSRAYFWASRRLFAAKETGKDVGDSIKTIGSKFSTSKEDNVEVYPDPSGDPTKFFQRNDDFQRDVYQIGLFLALMYFLVQYLRATL